MRKDVKFGATVGGILLATIVVYVIVISSGGANHPDNKTVATGEAVTPVTPPGDAAPTSGAVSSGAVSSGAVPANTSSAAGSGSPTHLDNLPTTPPSSSVATGTAANDLGSAATQPSQASGQKFDWDNALTSGSAPIFAGGAPEHTETPTIGSKTSSVPRIDGDAPAAAGPTPIAQAAPTAPTAPPSMSARAPVMIDDLPSTRPDVAAQSNPSPVDSVPTTPTAQQPKLALTTPRTHVIASGESLWSIAAAVYGDAKYYIRIAEANPDVDPKHLKVGKTLTIPALTDMDRKSRVAAPAGDSPASGASASPAPAEKIDSTTQYKVVAGDSLEQIAKRLYGKAAMKDKLYEANKELIGSNENTLKIGWVLKLPEAPTLP